MKIEEQNEDLTPEEIENDAEETEEENEETVNEAQTDINEDIAPENYDYSAVELPEGFELDKELTDEFSKAAKEMNLSQEKANKYMNLGVKLSQKIQTKFEDALKEAQTEKIKEYEELLKSDKEIGGNKTEKALRDANIAYDKFVSDDAAKLLAESGLNKHPAIIKVFMNIGKQIKDDTIKQQGDSRKERSAADWYPSMTKEK